MRSNRIEEVDVVGIVRRAVAKEPSAAAFARKAGVHRVSLFQQMNGDSKGFNDKVLRAAGLRRVVTVHYEFVEDNGRHAGVL